tara:strand:- start:65 stop:1903 length:1839 start_codon:yes stop_codon:yes gene_type:complete
MNEEDNLSEEGLGEVIKNQDKKLKEDLDEINYRNKELERRQKEQQPDIPGLFEARSGFRTGTGLAFEILANTGLDFFTFVPGTQQAGSAFINYLAQKIRGGEVSKGEILAAAATSQIPGLSQASALTKAGRLTRSVAKGGIAGGVTSTSMSLVDEGELPSFGEFATGVTAGGLMGGAFDLAPAALTGKLGKEVDDIKYDSSVFLKQFKSRLTGGPRIDHMDLGVPTFFGEGTVAAAKPTQYRLLFNWESQGAKPKANIGDTVDIVPRKVRRAKNLVTRKGIKFTKPDSVDLTNGFKATKQHQNFSEFIEDLIEADRIPARNITPQGFKAVGSRSSTPDLDLYEDYIAGYFNTYNTLDGITKVTLDKKTLKLGGKSLDNLKDVERILKAYKLNPKAFKSGAFDPSSSTSKELVEAFAQSKDIDDFIVRNLNLQRHHIAILDDSFALVDGLAGNDLDRMYKIIDNEGLIVGNDSGNLQLLPQQLHQGFVHGTIWPIAGPNWTGTSNTAKLLRKDISRLAPEKRVKYVQQLKDAVDEITIFMDDIIDAYIKDVKKGGQITLKDKESFMEYAENYMSSRGLVETAEIPTVASTRNPNKVDIEVQDEQFAFGEDTGI